MTKNLAVSGRFRASHLIFIIGLALVLFGAAFLLASVSGKSGLPVAASFLLIGVGVVCAFLAIKLNKRSIFLFLASFLILAGFFIFLHAVGVMPLSLVRSWPLLSVFAGLSLLASGVHRYRRARLNYIICAALFTALGIFLLFFSLGVMPFSFRAFLMNWWPLLFAMAGIVLVLIALSAQRQV